MSTRFQKGHTVRKRKHALSVCDMRKLCAERNLTVRGDADTLVKRLQMYGDVVHHRATAAAETSGGTTAAKTSGGTRAAAAGAAAAAAATSGGTSAKGQRGKRRRGNGELVAIKMIKTEAEERWAKQDAL